jgi:hypothetical protein
MSQCNHITLTVESLCSYFGINFTIEDSTEYPGSGDYCFGPVRVLGYKGATLGQADLYFVALQLAAYFPAKVRGVVINPETGSPIIP